MAIYITSFLIFLTRKDYCKVASESKIDLENWNYPRFSTIGVSSCCTVQHEWSIGFTT